jgi:hypothetical protein
MMMLKKYISIPVQVSIFQRGVTMADEKKHAMEKRLSLHEVLESHSSVSRSIKQNLDMIFLSQEGDLYFDKFFGLELWNHNFESKKLRHDEKKQIEYENYSLIDRYE